MIRKTAGRMLALASILTLGAIGVSAQVPDDVTYARDVAPIIQQKCQVCHQPGSIAPMSLMHFEDVQPYADLVRSKVEDRIMPPWHIDRTVGIQEFKNDRGLTEGEIETIVAWVEAGIPFGDEKDLPPPAEFPDPFGWQFEEAESKIRWEVHMHAIGEIVEDSYVELGVWFYDEGNEPANRTRLKMFDARGAQQPGHPSGRGRGDAAIPRPQMAVATGKLPAPHAHAWKDHDHGSGLSGWTN